MHNDPELSGKYLGTISQDFVRVADVLRDASYQIRKAGFEFPIFPICKEPQPIGQLLIDRLNSQTEWNYFASDLMSCAMRLIKSERLALNFRSSRSAKNRSPSDNFS